MHFVTYLVVTATITAEWVSSGALKTFNNVVGSLMMRTAAQTNVKEKGPTRLPPKALLLKLVSTSTSSILRAEHVFAFVDSDTRGAGVYALHDFGPSGELSAALLVHLECFNMCARNQRRREAIADDWCIALYAMHRT